MVRTIATYLVGFLVGLGLWMVWTTWGPFADDRPWIAKLVSGVIILGAVTAVQALLARRQRARAQSR